MSGSRSLPVLMPLIPGQRWSCHSCSNCCRTLVSHLTAEERQRIDRQGWAQKLGVEPYVKADRSWVLNKHDDGACVFLDSDNRCRIHLEYGEEQKPLACQIFPFSVRAVPDGWQVSFRFDCPSAAASKGESLDRHQGWLQKLVRHLDHQCSSNDATNLARGLRASSEEIDAVLQRYTQWFKDEDLSLSRRFIGAVRVTAMLAAAQFKKVRGPRFIELLDILFGALPGECQLPDEEPADRQRGMLRQLAFAHAGYVTLAQLRSGFLGRLRRRKQQLFEARRFLKGIGGIPILPGFTSEPTFAQVESVEPAQDRVADIRDLVRRYLTARLAGRSVWGAGYYGWNVFQGLSALWLSVAAAGWLARYAAACADRSTMTLDDVTCALGIVDRAATRLPALGSFAERARVSYLMQEDGIARLIHAYRLSESGS